MMSYLWILLIGSLLASHARAQEEGDLAPTTSDPVTEDVFEEEPDVDTEAEATATEEPQVDDEAEPDADPESEVEETVIPTASDPEPEDAEPMAAEEEEEEDEEEEADTVAEETDAPVAEDSEITTETPADEIPPTEEPETEEDVETTTPIDEAEVFTEGSGVTSTPTAPPETSPTTQAAIPVGIDEEAKQTTTTLPPTTLPPTTLPPTTLPPTSGVKEVSLPTEAPAEHEVIPTTAGVSGEEETTTPVSIIRNAVNEIKSEVINAVQRAGTRMGFNHGTSSEVPEADTSGGDPGSGEGGSKPLAAVLSGIVVAAVGAVAGYFTYQKKKLCFKKKPEADPEAGNKGEKVDPADAQSHPETLAPLVEKKH